MKSQNIHGMNLTTRQSMKFSFFTFSVMLLSLMAAAQDSSKSKQVNITSSFKPTLKEAAKINFNPTPPTADTSRPRLQYSIPNQNLAFAFQPGTLKPLALQVDTGGKWDNESYVKFGYGNLKSPYLQAGLSAGDGRNVGFNAYAKHSSSEGEIDLQDYKSTSIDLSAFVKTSKNLEWNGRIGALQEDYNKYGGRFLIPGETPDSLEIRYQTWRGRLSFRNINRSELGISYAPELKVDVFGHDGEASESNTYLNVPLQKSFGTTFGVDLTVTGNLSRYKPDTKSAITNNYFSFAPSLLFKKSNVNIQAGIRPSWDNGDFKLFPNLMVEFNTTDNRFSVQGGWTGYLRNSGYQYTATMNPWIWAPVNVMNTRIEERYVGLKGSAGNHFTFGVKAGSNILHNQPLFINDTITGRSFGVVYEPKTRVTNLGGELGYTVGEKFSLISNLSVNQYKTDSAVKAWGLLPLEWKTTMRLLVLKDLYVNSTLYAFDGGWALNKEGRRNMPAEMDFSAGLEFKVWKYIKVWGQFNNILNKEYQRWNQYPVYGFNFLAGVVISFAQQN